jgi:hypothetical protein
MASKSSRPTFSIKESGDGYELLNPDGEVIAWTLDKQWAWRIVMGLELLDANDQQPTHGRLE